MGVCEANCSQTLCAAVCAQYHCEHVCVPDVSLENATRNTDCATSANLMLHVWVARLGGLWHVAFWGQYFTS